MQDGMDYRRYTLTTHINISDFLPAEESEKQGIVVMRKSVSFWEDGFRRLRKNKLAMLSMFVIFFIMVFSFIVPFFYPYSYDEQIRGSENLNLMEFSKDELERKDAGEFVFPHILGTDSLGRDYAIRIMMGSRISLLVGIIASAIILIVGSMYGSIAGYFGGKTDIIMMRIVDVIYTVPDFLIIILLSVTLKYPLKSLAENVSGFAWINTIGVGLISIFIVFSLLYWVGMARIVRSQILTLKEQDFVVAARSLGASPGRIIRKHLLTNCIGILIVTTTLQIPSSIFTESSLSFLGLGVNAPMPSLGSLAFQALYGISSYPHRLLLPSVAISLIILSFNLLGDGLRDAFDPKLKD
jgi:oligopeptide transport system permease protein